MPYQTQWVDPELYLRHQEVSVYHTYDDNDIDQGANTYWFTLDPKCGDDSCSCPASARGCRFVFDVRELKTYVEPEHPPHINIAKDSEEERTIKEKAWEEFHRSGIEEKARREAIEKAIELGLLTEKGVNPEALREKSA